MGAACCDLDRLFHARAPLNSNATGLAHLRPFLYNNCGLARRAARYWAIAVNRAQGCACGAYRKAPGSCEGALPPGVLVQCAAACYMRIMKARRFERT